MSTVNTETLTLYKNRLLYNGSRYKFYHDSRNYDQWLADNSDGTPYSKTVNYKSIDEPIPINEFIKDCDEYTYGSITNEGKTYYFFADSITTDAYKRTVINFTIDWWSTNWAKINCTKAHISRKSGTKPGYMPQPFVPYIQTVNEVGELKSAGGSSGQIVRDGIFLFSFIEDMIDPVTGDPVPDKMKYGAFNITQNTIKAVMEGTWQESCNIPDGNVLGIFVVPMLDETRLTGWSDSPQTLNITYKYLEVGVGYIPEILCVLDTPITSTEQEVHGIMDWYGLPVWECPIDTTIYGFSVVLEIGVTSCLMRFMPHTEPIPSVQDDEVTFGSEMSGKGFCYQCRQATLFIDKGTEYDYRDKSYDKNMLDIQARRDMFTQMTSAFESAGFGFAFGGAPGAAASMVGGTVEELGSMLSHDMYDPKILEQTRLHYYNMQDVMAVVGDAITDLYDRYTLSKKPAVMIEYKKMMDEDTVTIMNRDINTNGYYCDEITANLSNYFSRNRVIVADNVVVEGACNVIGKQQVVVRLQNGVEFK